MNQLHDLRQLFAWGAPCEFPIVGREPPVVGERSIQCKPGLSMRWMLVVDEDGKRLLRILWSRVPANVEPPLTLDCPVLRSPRSRIGQYFPNIAATVRSHVPNAADQQTSHPKY